MVVIILEQKQFPLQIKSAPEGYLIEILSTYRTDQSFDKWLGNIFFYQ